MRGIARHEASPTTAGRRAIRRDSLLPAVLFAIVFLATSRAAAQTSDTGLSFRFLLGYEWGLPGTIDRSPGALNTAELQSPGTGSLSGQNAVLGLEWGRLGLRSGEFGLAGRLEGTITIGESEFLSDPYERFGPGVDIETDEVVSAVYHFSVRTREARIQGALLGGFGLGRGISLTGGVWGGYRFITEIRQVEFIDFPNVVFPDGNDSRVRILGEGSGYGAFPVRFGGMIGGRADVGGFSLLRIEPEFFLRFDAESLFKDGVGLNAFSGGIGIGVRMGASRDRSDILEDSLRLLSRRFVLSSSVELYGIAEAGKEKGEIDLRPQHTIHHRYLPLIPIVSASQILSPPYALADASAADSFGVEKLHHLPAEQLPGHTLNLIGRRMKESAEGSLQIKGGRAAEVAEYLATVWGIGRDRIALSKERGDPDRIELASDDPSLLSPMSGRWVVDEFVPFRIGLSKKIEAEAGLHHWELKVRHGERMLAIYQSDSTNDREPTLTLEDLAGDDRLLPLEAELIVEDYRGMRDTSYASLSLGRTEAAPVEVESYEYWLLDPEGHPSIADANAALLEHFAGSARTGVTIEIAGDLDAEGSSFSGMTGDVSAARSSGGRARTTSVPSVERIAGDLLAALNERGVEIRSLEIERERVEGPGSDSSGRIRIRARQRLSGE